MNGRHISCSPEHVSQYVFGDELTEVGDTSHYTTHDWVADSALRLIAMSEIKDDDDVYYRDKIKWLLYYDYPSHLDEVEYKKLDDLGVGVADGHGSGNERLWWLRKNIGLCGFDSNPDKAEEKWLKIRRLVWLFHGTGFPDWNRKVKENGGSHVPSEKGRVKSPWFIESVTNHHFYWDYDENLGVCRVADEINTAPRIPDRGAYLARVAAQDAIEFLNFKKTYGQEEVSGKFELGAFCLGGMTHFIADVSAPPHVLYGASKWTNDDHNMWEYYADMYLRTHFTHTEPFTSYGNIFPSGGPSWSNSDPRNVGQALTAMDPYVAVMMMSLVTYSACDLGPQEFMGDSAAPNLDHDPFSTFNSDRSKKLLEWAAFYTACAIMWVLDKCNDNIMGDTVSDRFVSKADMFEAGNKDFSSREALKDYLTEKPSAQFSEYMGNQVANAAVASFSPILLFTSLSLLGTVSILVGVPIAGRVKEKEIDGS